VRDPIIAPSAYRHGIEEEDILHAYRNAYKSRTDQGDHSLTMLTGAARNGVVMLEVGIKTTGRQPVIIHAMKARAQFL